MHQDEDVVVPLSDKTNKLLLGALNPDGAVPRRNHKKNKDSMTSLVGSTTGSLMNRLSLSMHKRETSIGQDSMISAPISANLKRISAQQSKSILQLGSSI